MSIQTLLLRRLQAVLRQWPEDASKKGRDLGEFLSQNYKAKFQEECYSDAAKAREAVEGLEKLNSDYYRKLYKRETEYSYSERPISVVSQALSNDNLKEMRRKSRSLWDRITRREDKGSYFK